MERNGHEARFQPPPWTSHSAPNNSVYWSFSSHPEIFSSSFANNSNLQLCTHFWTHVPIRFCELDFRKQIRETSQHYEIQPIENGKPNRRCPLPSTVTMPCDYRPVIDTPAHPLTDDRPLALYSAICSPAALHYAKTATEWRRGPQTKRKHNRNELESSEVSLFRADLSKYTFGGLREAKYCSEEDEQRRRREDGEK